MGYGQPKNAGLQGFETLPANAHRGVIRVRT
jgi:hypothetical protein